MSHQEQHQSLMKISSFMEDLRDRKFIEQVQTEEEKVVDVDKLIGFIKPIMVRYGLALSFINELKLMPEYNKFVNLMQEPIPLPIKKPIDAVFTA